MEVVARIKPTFANFSASQYDLSFEYIPPAKNDLEALEKNPFKPPPPFVFLFGAIIDLLGGTVLYVYYYLLWILFIFVLWMDGSREVSVSIGLNYLDMLRADKLQAS